MKRFNPMLIIPQLKELWKELADLHKVLDEADTATDNANQSAQTANAAADFANSQRGWSPKFVFEEDGAQRLVKKLDSWIGGTSTPPTDNVGMYVANGGYTADISLATNFKGAEGAANGVVEEGNLEAVSGGAVFDAIKANSRLQNLPNDLTPEEKNTIREKLGLDSSFIDAEGYNLKLID